MPGRGGGTAHANELFNEHKHPGGGCFPSPPHAAAPAPHRSHATTRGWGLQGAITQEKKVLCKNQSAGMRRFGRCLSWFPVRRWLSQGWGARGRGAPSPPLAQGMRFAGADPSQRRAKGESGADPAADKALGLGTGHLSLFPSPAPWEPPTQSTAVSFGGGAAGMCPLPFTPPIWLCSPAAGREHARAGWGRVH